MAINDESRQTFLGRLARKFRFVGLSEERQYFVENLSLMIGAGVGVGKTLESIKEELRSRRMKILADEMAEKVNSGAPLWKALDQTGIIPKRVIKLVQIGEHSGNLPEYLRVVALAERRERGFRSKIKSALMYPAFVFFLTIIVGIGVAWFILPRLSEVFVSLDINLPAVTKGLIKVGSFLSQYGNIVMPIIILFIVAIFYFVFLFQRTRFIGQFIVFYTPALGKLYRNVELARFGYLLGTLLERGIPIADSLESLLDSTSSYHYKKLYAFLKKAVDEGWSLEKSFREYKHTDRLIPRPIQGLIVAASYSGRLAQALTIVGETFEERTETTMKNVAVLLEPILLVIVWVGVVLVALAVILPIYSLIGQFG